MKKNIPHIAIFASGSGSNAVKIIEHFTLQKIETHFCVLSNKPQAPVLGKAKKLGIETLVFSREEFFNSDKIVEYLQSKNVSLIVLAGFLWLVPENIIKNTDLIIKPMSESDSLMNMSKKDSVSTSNTPPDTTVIATKQRKGDINTKIDYSSQDSMFFALKTQNLYLYGDSKVKYGSINLTADRILVNWQDKTIKADYSLDSAGLAAARADE